MVPSAAPPGLASKVSPTAPPKVSRARLPARPDSSSLVHRRSRRFFERLEEIARVECPAYPGPIAFSLVSPAALSASPPTRVSEGHFSKALMACSTVAG